MQSRLAIGLLLAALVAPTNAHAKYPWEKEPGPIAGVWQASCSGAKDFVIEVTVGRDGKRATGRVAAVGKGDALKRGYLLREEILRLTADDYGDWVGHFKWRSASGAERWEPIRLVATADLLNATMTIDDCFRSMSRTH
jgi:hypothetical protein